MILRRLGNKKKLANNLFAHFPEHDLYIEPFFGAGGMFFNKPKAKYNIVNDNDSAGFNQQDSADLFETLISTGVRFAMSEFNQPFIVEQAKKYGLNIIEIGERKNLKNRRMEVLITNYQS